MSDALAGAITDHIAAVLLRYFRNAVVADAGVQRIDIQRDRDMLRLQWALSAPVAQLCEYILAHRHETQSFLATRIRSEAGLIRGRIDARATLMLRMVGGNLAQVVAHEPIRSFYTGPNHVTAWVLQQAWLLASRFTAMLPVDATYRDLAVTSTGRLERVRKIDAISAAMEEVQITRRPGAGALRAAAQSRQRTYRLAYDAYTLLAAIEAGEPEAIEATLRGSLIGPLETWRRFELAAGLAVAEALSRATGAPMHLSLLAGDTRRPMATVGRFAVFWQSRTQWYSAAAPEPFEALVEEVLARYGLRPDSDRPDLIVADTVVGSVCAVIEVKYSGGAADDGLNRLREAAHQVVRYARGYRPVDEIGPLIDRSAIVLVRRPDLPEALGSPRVLGFDDMRSGDRFDEWAKHVL